jgi:hypothetical protein
MENLPTSHGGWHHRKISLHTQKNNLKVHNAIGPTILRLPSGALVKYYSKVTLKSFIGLILGVSDGAGANGHQYYWVLTSAGIKNCYDGNLTMI